jgi:LytS/YehU family sensor histidine kinase
LVLTVRDTGRGLSDGPSDGTRFGLQQVRDRLNALYGGAASFMIENAADAEGGTIATIRMPMKTS